MLTRVVRRRIFRLTFLLALLLAFVLDLRSAPSTPAAGGHRGSDQAFHTAIIRRVHAGESYYPVVAQELRNRHYPAASPFNWRTPFLSTALAVDPSLGHASFIAVVGLVLIASLWVLARQSPPVAVAGALAVSGAVMVIFDPGVWVFHEVWAGCLLALSVFAYDRRQDVLGFLTGLSALFVRELAGPYTLLCLGLAAHARRTREVAAWVGGFALYGAYYTMHVQQVLSHQRLDDTGHTAGWLQVGGLNFVADTLRTNSLLHTAPRWCRVAVLVVLVTALMGSSLSSRLRLTVALYLAFFFFVGQSFNWHWGWLVGFLLPLVFAHGLSVIGDLFGHRVPSHEAGAD